MKNFFGYTAVIFAVISAILFHLQIFELSVITVAVAILSAWWFVESMIEVSDHEARAFKNKKV